MSLMAGRAPTSCPAAQATTDFQAASATTCLPIVFTTQFGFDDVLLANPELGERLHEADLFGFV